MFSMVIRRRLAAKSATAAHIPRTQISKVATAALGCRPCANSKDPSSEARPR